ncbi:NADH:ubiquinone reductase (Na(+)-transporting) subunit C [Psychroflexus planctonicus]|uniref:Na(+)-translocating NADH-quinone reductase subunit C n=1 Tax=Psychroflexus planctonicus TaxID=1526575 RepID=A0ABQ1SFJ8_9FLAO|nr:NADH:ubiquinone reductase (Na(+)-transporting) subunit C [Psychroflexus planctonicus]GGE35811.1 Na(+)-translocating NADH-quinone reductase subunit C [Psychroflexus planctonicus]
MDKNSNQYTILFAIAMVIVVAVALSFAATSLQPMQAENVRQEKMQDILSTFIGDSIVLDGKKVELDRAVASKVYKEYVSEQLTLDHEGNQLDDVDAFQVNLARELKKPVDEQVFPLYVANFEGETYYVVPLRGKGLWDAIWGYVALKEDINTIKGVTFDHKGETAGLGAEITTDWFQERFTNEEVFNDEGELVGVIVEKGYSANKKGDNRVNSISGATITGDGVTDMMQERLSRYLPYFKTKKNSKLATR